MDWKFYFLLICCEGQETFDGTHSTGDIRQDNVTSLTAPYICAVSSTGEALVENNLFI